MLVELFAELHRVTEVLAASSGREVARAHVASVKALTRLLEDVATQTPLPQQTPLDLEALVIETISLLEPDRKSVV